MVRGSVSSGVLLLLAGLAGRAEARDVGATNDSAFNGHVTESLTPPSGPPASVTTWSLTSNGVTFDFTSLGTDPRALLINAGSLPYLGIQSWEADPEEAGVSVTISPPVSAVGFDGRAIQYCPQATFTGVTDVESVDVTDQGGNCYLESHFFGAADIGAISSVVLVGEGAIFTVQNLVFVPPGASTGSADVRVGMTTGGGLSGTALDGEALDYVVTVANDGPEAATNVVVSDLLPAAAVYESASAPDASGAVEEHDLDGDPAPEVIQVVDETLASGGSFALTIGADTPARSEFSCESAILNLALVGSDAADPDLSDNVAFAVTTFDKAAVETLPEICGNGIDDNCDGITDCGGPECPCRPRLPSAPGAPDGLCFVDAGVAEAIIVMVEPDSGCPSIAAEEHACTVPRGVCGGVTVPAWCCDPYTWSNPANNGNLAACDLGVPGCVPRDPNWKDAVPHVNLWGYGYTEAGAPIAYEVHYENVGDADAHDVLVIDVLDPDLDAATLVIDDGGVWDADTRTITWSDPVVPPATPRSVTFTADVRADALPGTRVRNVATVVFPDAVPPTRIDTNFVEHAIPSPDLELVPDFSVVECTETEAGSGEWRVRLLNDGPGFAYGVMAEVIGAPSSDLDGVAVEFGHPDDPLDGSVRTVIPFAVTTSLDTFAFAADDDPCASLTWLVTWDDRYGNVSTVEIGPDAGDDDDDAYGSCGCAGNCSTTSGAAGLPLALAAVLMVRRRRWTC